MAMLRSTRISTLLLAVGCLWHLGCGKDLSPAEKDALRMALVPLDINQQQRKALRHGRLYLENLDELEKAFLTKYPKERYKGGVAAKVHGLVLLGFRTLKDHRKCWRDVERRRKTSGAGRASGSLCHLSYKIFVNAAVSAVSVILPIIRKNKKQAKKIILKDEAAVSSLKRFCAKSKKGGRAFCSQLGF